MLIDFDYKCWIIVNIDAKWFWILMLKTLNIYAKNFEYLSKWFLVLMLKSFEYLCLIILNTYAKQCWILMLNSFEY